MSFKWSDHIQWSISRPWNWVPSSGSFISPINIWMPSEFRFATHPASKTDTLTSLHSLELISMTFGKKAGIMISEAGGSAISVGETNSQGVTFG